ncbi:dinuclear metal center YbgI/SA1388 family protein [Bacillus mesophilus]|uniref:GTP cyclohydrolase 1 type 2 homolog n=1 Tax=Bacillus mesophilus TaxID=1808955 RepID=A0A6M0Q5U1_9BACI|nr:dinuclear metal center YbgI/SA1388 family protein [Bacillus mesophilus]NEY71643.1 Nif3-like dinuclear metal center hexameric protein [Bacillus mesophilus]
MTKIPNGFEVISLFERFSPMSLALENDKYGLQIGTLNKPIHHVMVTLDVLESVIDEAIEKKIDLIISHHPPIFRPIKHVRTDSATGRIIEKCIKHDIAVYSAHTNLDITNGGVNDLLAEALQLKDIKVLAPTYKTALKKLVVFVPATHAEGLREALGKAGAGHIGNYSYCTFNTRGMGMFKPEEGTTPYIGQQGQLEEVEEVKVETIFSEDLQRKVLSAMQKAHPYEEVAYDVYPLENTGKESGLGRIGLLDQEMTLGEFAEIVKRTFNVDGVRVVGDLSNKVKKVAVLGGDGNKYIHKAHFAGADVFVSGDIYFHFAHEAMDLGLNIVDPGHHIEKVMIQGVAAVLKTEMTTNHYAVTVHLSETNTNPFQFK